MSTSLFTRYCSLTGQGPVNPDEQQIQGLWQKADRGKHTEFPSDDTGGDNGLSFPSATVQQMVEGNGQAQNGNGLYANGFFSYANGLYANRYRILEQILEQSTSSNTLHHGKSYYMLLLISLFPPRVNEHDWFSARQQAKSIVRHHQMICR